MGFTPPTLATQTSLGAATSTWANTVKEYLDWHESVNKTDSRPYAVLQASTTQTLGAGATVVINFDVEQADVGNGHAASSNTYIIPTAGLWLLGGIATFGSTTTTNPITAYLILNSAVNLATDSRLGTGASQSICLNTIWPCAAGDNLTLQQFSAAASTTTVSAQKPTLFAYRLNS